MNDRPQTKRHCIAYLDVLGYSEFLKAENGDETVLFKAVSQLVETAAGITNNEAFRSGGFISKAFSDNVLLAVDLRAGGRERQAINGLILIAGLLQYQLFLKHGMLMRGSIVLGDLYVDELFVFGEGLVDAAGAEKLAKYPRVTVDKSVDALSDPLAFVIHDDDKALYIDFFQYSSLSILENGALDAETNNLRELRENIVRRVKKYCSFPGGMKDLSSIAAKESVITKHLWLLTKFNDYCRQSGKEELIISYKAHLNRRLMKYELRIDS